MEPYEPYCDNCKEPGFWFSTAGTCMNDSIFPIISWAFHNFVAYWYIYVAVILLAGILTIIIAAIAADYYISEKETHRICNSFGIGLAVTGVIIAGIIAVLFLGSIVWILACAIWPLVAVVAAIASAIGIAFACVASAICIKNKALARMESTNL